MNMSDFFPAPTSEFDVEPELTEAEFFEREMEAVELQLTEAEFDEVIDVCEICHIDLDEVDITHEPMRRTKPRQGDWR